MTIAENLMSPAEMEEAYLEYRGACYHIIYRHAKDRGLLDKLETPKTVDEISQEMGFLTERQPTLTLFLKALVRYRVLTCTSDQPTRYVRSPGFSEAAITFDRDLIGKAAGQDKVEDLIHGQSYAGIIDTLSKQENAVAAEFVSGNVGLWNEFLQAPFYSYGRDRAAAAIAQPSGRVLDLASGLGFGLIDLANKVGTDGLAVGVEVSRDFVCETVQRTSDLQQIRTIQCDLDIGFPFLRDNYFDGAMLIGAFHFLKNRAGLFENTQRVLKPGGKFCLGYVYLQEDSYDQELMDLRLSLRQPPARPITKAEMTELGQRNGFKLEEEFSIGCFGWFLFVK